MTLTSLLVPTYVAMLTALSNWIDKAIAHDMAAGAPDNAGLLYRLAPDMYPLAGQIRFVCFQAQEAAYRLRGEATPDALLLVRKEGWQSNDQPGSWADAQAHVTDALGFLGDLSSTALDAGADRMITLSLPNGMVFDMTGEQYARDWALPQFYFHLTTTYAILRHTGVNLGKADFVPHVLAYLRPQAPSTGG